MDEEVKPASQRAALAAMWRWLRPERPALVAALALALLATAADLALPWLVGRAVDAIAAAGAISAILAALAALMTLRAAGAWATGWLLQAAAVRATSRMRGEVAARLIRLPLPEIERSSTGRLATRGTSDVAAAAEGLAVIAVNLVRDVLLIIGAAALMVALDPRLGLAALCAVPPAIAVAWAMRKRSREHFRAIRAKVAQINGWLGEHIAGMAAVQGARREARAAAEFDRLNQAEFDAGLRQVRLFGVGMPLVGLGATLAVVLVLAAAGWNATSEGITAGTVVAMIGYVELLFSPVRDLAEKHNQLQAAGAATERILAVLALPPEDPGRGQVPDGHGSIVFDGVWFAYGDGADGRPGWVLRGIDLTIPAGTTLALVGPTGAGKSTIAALLLRLRIAQRGRVLVDGVDVRQWDLAALRARIATVMQDPGLTAGTIASNAAWHAEIAPDRIDAALADAGLAGRGGNRVGSGGDGLSAGERQQVAMARALAGDPRIVVLDEATAALDSATEARLVAAMRSTLAQRTAVVIAHRLATVREADRIAVIDHGTIIELGDHATLVARGGRYAAMIAAAGGDGRLREDAAVTP